MKKYNIHVQAIVDPKVEKSYPKCTDCSACCTLSPLLTAEEFESGKFIYSLIDISGIPTLGIPLLNGKCLYFIDNKCSIYEDRPTACHQFDCRKGHHPKFKTIALEKFGEYIEN